MFNGIKLKGFGLSDLEKGGSLQAGKKTGSIIMCSFFTAGGIVALHKIVGIKNIQL